MNETAPATKNFLTSKTILGIAILLLPQIKTALGIDLSPEEVTGLFTNLDALFTLVCAIVGSVVSIYGRVKASVKIRFFKK